MIQNHLMWIDLDAKRKEFGRGLFSHNEAAFAYYTDPDGFAEIHRLREPDLKSKWLAARIRLRELRLDLMSKLRGFS